MISFFTDTSKFRELLKILECFFHQKYTRFSNIECNSNDTTLFARQIYKRGIISNDHLNECSKFKISNEFLVPKIICVDESQFLSLLNSWEDESFLIIMDDFFICSFKQSNIYYLNSLEKNKNLNTIKNILDFISASKNFEKIKYIVGVGGGITLDIAGFVASMMQCKLFFVPTTLLAAIDATLGGKVGVNFEPFGKNQVGTFYFCEQIIIASHFLKTLSYEQLLSGLCEALKHFWLEGNLNDHKKICQNILAKDLSIESMDSFILKNLSTKLKIIQNDPFDNTGVRSVLNFGHTIGHALEVLSLSNDSPIPHGIAVAYGMIFVIQNYYDHLSLDEKDFLTLLNQIIELYPINIQQYSLVEWKNILIQDKKNLNSSEIKFSLPSYGIIKRLEHDKNLTKNVSIEDVLKKI